MSADKKRVLDELIIVPVQNGFIVRCATDSYRQSAYDEKTTCWVFNDAKDLGDFVRDYYTTEITIMPEESK